MCRTRLTWLGVLAAVVMALVSPRSPLAAQTTPVRGRVVNEQDAPLAGVAVAVQGGTQRAVTGNDGRFTLNVPNANVSITVTRIGYAAQTVALAGRTQVEVKLTATALQIDELVVVGYGTQKKSDVTGSVASVNTQRLETTPTVTIEQAIQGLVPGVSVSTAGGGAEGNTSILVRGQSSIKASSEPLIVIDGIPFGGSLSEINQNDVASIDILKDASATAIYGSRGSNGVILITSKKGGGRTPSIAYQGYSGIQNISNLPDLMNGQEFAAYKCQRLAGGQNCDAVLTATELANSRAGNSTDWVGLATRQGFQQSHTLSFSGGTGGTRYYLSGSVLDVKGVARGDDFDRYALRVNLDQDIRSWLTLGTNTQMSMVDRSGVSASFENAFYMNPLTTPFNDDGTQRVTPWAEDTFFGNPLQGLLATDEDRSRRVFTANYAEAKLPLRGLTARVNAGLDFADRNSARYYGRNTRTGLDALGSASVGHDERWDWTLESLLHFRRDFGKHGVDLTGLVSGQGNNLDENDLNSSGFPNDVLTYYQANVGSAVNPSVNVTHSRLLSQMGRVNYSYDSRYLLTLTARRDGYSGFGEGHKWGVFPSLALGWNIDRESFFNVDAINTLKLRASYGNSGNQAIAPYQTLAGLDDYSYLTGDATAPGYIPRSLGNTNLRWETTTSSNVGLDVAMWNNRVRGSLDVYNRDTHDLLLNRTISLVHGVTQIAQNIGKTRNRGVELQLSTVNVARKRFGWSSDFNVAANRNRIVDLYGNGRNDLTGPWFIGEPILVNYEYEFGGIWQQGEDIAHSAQPTAKPGDVKIVDRNGDGKITPDDQTIIGNRVPSWTGGFNNTFRFGAFSLTGFIYTVQGVTASNNLLGTNQVQALVRRNTVKRQYWTPENPINTYPANSETSNPLSVGFFEDASFIRLRDLTLGWDIPSAYTDRLGASSLRLYVNGHNLWTRTEWSGLDPELVQNTAIQRSTPLERTFTAGLNVRF